MPFRKAVLSLAVLMLASASLALAQGTYAQIDVPGASFTYCYGVNTNGDIVGFYGNTSGAFGVLLSGGIYTTIVYPGASVTKAIGINDEGQIVGVTNVATAGFGFLYDVTTQVFTKITYPGWQSTAPLAINNAATIVGVGASSSGSSVSFEQVASGKQKLLAVPGASATYAQEVSSSAVVVGYYIKKGQQLNFLFSGGKYRQLSIPNEPTLEVTGTNPAGTAYVGFDYANGTGFLYQNKVLQTLQFPGASSTYAYGVNAVGEVVGYFYDTSSNLHGFTWTPPADVEKK